VFEFPLRMFLQGSDLTPIKENVDKIIFGLTKWEPRLKETIAAAPDTIAIEGRDYEEAAASMNNLFLRNCWSDGLPLIPATEGRVRWMLAGSPFRPNTVIGRILPVAGSLLFRLLQLIWLWLGDALNTFPY